MEKHHLLSNSDVVAGGAATTLVNFLEAKLIRF